MGHEKFKVELFFSLSDSQDLTTAHYSGVLIIFLFFDITQLDSLWALVCSNDPSYSTSSEYLCYRVSEFYAGVEPALYFGWDESRLTIRAYDI
jgi:hypothetical protein